LGFRKLGVLGEEENFMGSRISWENHEKWENSSIAGFWDC
jgi:hypothetical protein